jgi:molybdopterin-binding protein
MQLSARNQLKGTVMKVEHGAVNSEVTIELAEESKWFQSSRRNQQSSGATASATS